MPSTSRKDRRLRSSFRAVIGILLATAVALALTAFVPQFRVLENGLRDVVQFTFYPRTSASEEVVIVAISEETLARLPYRSPVDRAFLANLIETLAAAEPKGIIIDILFDRATEAPKDEKLRTAITSPRSFPIVAATVDARIELTDRQNVFMSNYLAGASKGLAILIADADDGVVRRFAPDAMVSGERIATLASAVSGNPMEGVLSHSEPIAFRYPDDLLAAPFAVYDAHLAPMLPAAWFADKYVLIGADVPQTDRFVTPVDSVLGRSRGTPGVVIHAHILQQILDRRRIVELPVIGTILLAMGSAGAAVLLLRIPYPITIRVAALGLGVVLFLIAAGLALRMGGVTTPVLAPIVAALISGATVLAREWREDRRQKAFIRSAFNRYVSPDVVDQLVADPSVLNSKPELRRATCIFTDVAGFTAFAERHRHNPEKIEFVLNEYLSGMTRIFFKHGATIDKFVGDAVVGFVGGPLPREDHATVTLAMAAELDRFAVAFASKHDDAEGTGFGQTRIGVHTGAVLLGNFGGDEFFDYTAIGDTVNIASRIESSNRMFGTRVCFSGDTLREAGGVSHRIIGRVALKGKVEEIELFELVTNPDTEAALEDYLVAYRAMERRDPAAPTLFKQLRKRFVGDGLIAYHHTRLERGETGASIRMTDK